jgi:hypothetical protein
MAEAAAAISYQDTGAGSALGVRSESVTTTSTQSAQLAAVGVRAETAAATDTVAATVVYALIAVAESVSATDTKNAYQNSNEEVGQIEEAPLVDTPVATFRTTTGTTESATLLATNVGDITLRGAARVETATSADAATATVSASPRWLRVPASDRTVVVSASDRVVLVPASNRTLVAPLQDRSAPG